MPYRAGFRKVFAVTALGLLTAYGGGRGGGSDDGSPRHTALFLPPNIYGANPAKRQMSDLDRAIGVYDDLMENQRVVEDVNDTMSSTPVAYSLWCSDYFSLEARDFEFRIRTSNALLVAMLA